MKEKRRNTNSDHLRMGDYEINAWQHGQSMDLWRMHNSNELDSECLGIWHSKTPWAIPGLGIFQNVNGEIVQLQNARAKYLELLRSHRPV